MNHFQDIKEEVTLDEVKEQNIIANDSPIVTHLTVKDSSIIQKISGGLGVTIGILSSAEFFLLGYEFGYEIAKKSSGSGVLFGVISFIPNSSLNIAVNKETMESMVTFDNACNCSLKCIGNKILKSGVIINSTIASFALTALLLENLRESDPAIKVVLGTSTFISNIALFYYSTTEFFTLSFIKLKEYFSNRNLLNYRNRLSVIFEKTISDIYRLKINDYVNLPTDEVEKLKSVLDCSIEQSNTSKRFLSFMLQATGYLVGALAVVSYKNVGQDSVHALNEFINIEEHDRQFLMSFFGYNTFAAFLFFAMDLTAEGLQYIFQQLTYLNPNFKYNTLLAISGLLSLASSIPNGRIAMEYFSDTNFFLKTVLVASAFISPAIINFKWLHSAVNKISISPKLASIGLFCKNSCNKFNSETQYRYEIYNDKYKFINGMENLQREISTMDESSLLEVVNLVKSSAKSGENSQFDEEPLINTSEENSTSLYQRISSYRCTIL